MEEYNRIRTEKALEDASEPSSKTFAPSSFRCDRKCWFRLRGTVPDVPPSPDLGLDFRADLGTACHEMIQKNLKSRLKTGESGIEWVEVEDYLNAINFGNTYEYTVERNGYETSVEVFKPYPIRFSVDGILRINGKYYLLEIKTAEYSSFDNLTDPKEQHVDQVKVYCAILRLDSVIFMYQDRQNGDIKVYEETVNERDKAAVFQKMDAVIKAVETNLAPNRLPNRDDPWCRMCDYKKKCQQWG